MRLWVAQAISQTAQNAVWYGILVLVQHRSNSSAHMGVAITTLVLPSVLFGLVAGVYVDRWDKRLVLVGSNLLRVAITLAYVLASEWLGLVYVVNFLFATVSQFFGPAEGACIPALVHRRLLLQANSMFHFTFTTSQVVGLVVVGPLLVNLLGLDGLFIAVAVLFGICALLVWPLPSLPASEEVQPSDKFRHLVQGLREDVREVFAFFRSDPLITLSIGHWTLGSILSIAIAMLAPAYVVKVLALRAEQSVLLLAPAGVGMLVGTILISRQPRRLNKQVLIHAGMLVTGLALLALGLVQNLWSRMLEAASPMAEPPRLGLLAVVMLIAFAAGLAFVAIIVPSQTLMQERAPVGLRGRVISVALMLGNVISVLPLLFLGAFADMFGVEPTFGMLGLGMLVVALASQRVSRRIWVESADDRRGLIRRA